MLGTVFGLFIALACRTHGDYSSLFRWHHDDLQQVNRVEALLCNLKLFYVSNLSIVFIYCVTGSSAKNLEKWRTWLCIGFFASTAIWHFGLPNFPNLAVWKVQFGLWNFVLTLISKWKFMSFSSSSPLPWPDPHPAICTFVFNRKKQF